MHLRCFWLESRRQMARNRAHVVDTLLRANERAISLSEVQAIARIDVSQLAANRPVEDFYSASKCLTSNAYLLGVFDGHGGSACARHVCTRLYDYICASALEKHLMMDIAITERLQWLFSSADQRLPLNADEEHEKNVREYYNRFKKNKEMMTVRKTLQAAFLALDEDLSRGAMPDSQGRISRMNVNVAASGACALVTNIRKNHLHVANIGDCSAVLGVQMPNGIAARQLTRPHTVDNVDEIQRLRSAHPSSESATILRSGRLLGELIPLRAFGDVRYKWPMQLQKVVLEPLGMPAPLHLHTPPYLNAQPEVFYHQLTANDRFMVLATDGLWEFLDPDTVVRLVHDHTLGAQTLSLYQPHSGQSLGEILQELDRRKEGDSKKPLDENSATHLIRNALGGCSGGTELQYARLEESLQLPPGMARHYRDDITVIVIHFNQNYLQETQP